jgi:hypothetical protein
MKINISDISCEIYSNEQYALNTVANLMDGMQNFGMANYRWLNVDIVDFLKKKYLDAEIFIFEKEYISVIRCENLVIINNFYLITDEFMEKNNLKLIANYKNFTIYKRVS